MTLGNSQTDARHRAIQTESKAGYYTAMRQRTATADYPDFRW